MSGEQLAALELEHRWRASEKRCAELEDTVKRLRYDQNDIYQELDDKDAELAAADEDVKRLREANIRLRARITNCGRGIRCKPNDIALDPTPRS